MHWLGWPGLVVFGDEAASKLNRMEVIELHKEVGVLGFDGCVRKFGLHSTGLLWALGV